MSAKEEEQSEDKKKPRRLVKPPGKGTIEDYRKVLTQAGYEGAARISKKAEIREYYQWCQKREEELDSDKWTSDTTNTCALKALQDAGLAIPVSDGDYGNARLGLRLLCEMVEEKTKWREEFTGIAVSIPELGLIPNEQITDSLFLYLAIAMNITIEVRSEAGSNIYGPHMAEIIPDKRIIPPGYEYYERWMPGGDALVIEHKLIGHYTTVGMERTRERTHLGAPPDPPSNEGNPVQTQHEHQKGKCPRPKDMEEHHREGEQNPPRLEGSD